MSNLALLTAKIKALLRELADKTKMLGVGLQQAAPQHLIASNQSIQYLHAITDQLESHIQQADALPKKATEDKTLVDELVQLSTALVKADDALREQFSIGEKFRFVRDKLHGILQLTNEELKIVEHATPVERKISEDECDVYVHLFNAQGANVQSWNNLVHPAAFYEHSVNRPIYQALSDAKAFLRATKTKAQHGFLKIIIKKQAILPQKNGQSLKDTYGHALLKVKEGGLMFENCVGFFHNEIEYSVDENGNLIKK